MIKPYLKGNCLYLKGLFTLLIAVSGLIYGCRKELLKNETTTLSISDPKAVKAKSWCKATYPKSNLKPLEHNVNTVGVTNEITLTQLLSPDCNVANYNSETIT